MRLLWTLVFVMTGVLNVYMAARVAFTDFMPTPFTIAVNFAVLGAIWLGFAYQEANRD